MTELESFFSAAGPLARVLPNYSPRRAQLAMAHAVESAIAEERTLMAEAGTGTGKTYAYLVPAILSGQRIIVSTRTRNLQDQLFVKDLPIIRKALGLPLRTVLLKGRANYLCHYRLQHAVGFSIGQRPQDVAQLESLARWAKTTVIGDKSEVSDVADDSPLWRAVTSTAENCLGQDCPNYADCCVAAARRRAHEALILVINHHLLWADWALKSDGLGELLPEADVVIVDEAHQFAESASQFLGTNLGSRQLDECVEDLRAELGQYPGEFPELLEDGDRLVFAVQDLRHALGVPAERYAWHDVALQPAVQAAFDTLAEHLAHLGERLGTCAERSSGLESCWQRALALKERLDEFRPEAGDDPSAIRWLEAHRSSFHLHKTPIDIARDFAEFHATSGATWIFTSATLASAGCFAETARALGLENAASFCCESPFDYRRQCLLYVPPALPEPTATDYTERAIQAVLRVLTASQGRAFLLFTSHQSLNRAAELLRQSGLGYPLFVQGSQPKALLLERFEQSGNGILLGTASFWEGVDIRGSSLSCVIIDKLPFASPGDPVLAARIQAIKTQGGDPFRSLQLPAAVLTLRQGFGRLIRGVDDRGVFVLCDPRVLSRWYGRRFLQSLPEMPLTQTIDEVEAFFAADPSLPVVAG